MEIGKSMDKLLGKSVIGVFNSSILDGVFTSLWHEVPYPLRQRVENHIWIYINERVTNPIGII